MQISQEKNIEARQVLVKDSTHSSFLTSPTLFMKLTDFLHSAKKLEF